MPIDATTRRGCLMAEYRAHVQISLVIESGSLLRAQELVAEEITGIFAGNGTVEIRSSNIDVGEQQDDPPSISGFPPPSDLNREALDIQRQMLEVLERVHPKKPDWDRGADGVT